MFKPITKKVSRHLPGKINILRKSVVDEQQLYMQGAKMVDDKKLKKTISTLADELDRHAYELCRRLIAMGINEKRLNSSDAYPLSANIGVTGGCAEEAVVSHFCQREHALVNAYRAILNEPFLSQDLRQVLRHQLNDVMYGFVRLKLLKGTFSTHDKAHFLTIDDMI